MNTTQTCGYTLVGRDGEEGPCGRPVTGWRWYQDVEHEDCLERACSLHANEGGRRIHAAETEAHRLASVVASLAPTKPQFMDDWYGWGIRSRETGEDGGDIGNRAYLDWMAGVIKAAGRGKVDWLQVGLAVILDRSVRADETRRALQAPPPWPCSNYHAPHTCNTTGCTTPCDYCAAERKSA